MSPNATGNTARNNIIGLSPLGQAAPLNRNGIHVRNNTKSHVLEGNVIRNAGTYGIGLTQHDVLWIKISRNIIDRHVGHPDLSPAQPEQSVDRRQQPAAGTADHVGNDGPRQRHGHLRRNGRGLPRFARCGQSGLPIAYLGSTVVATNGTWTMPIVVPSPASASRRCRSPSGNNTSAPGRQRDGHLRAGAAAAPDADFTASQRAGTLTVDFTDSSTNSPATWSWDFDDGSSSTRGQSVAHLQPGRPIRRQPDGDQRRRH